MAKFFFLVMVSFLMMAAPIAGGTGSPVPSLDAEGTVVTISETDAAILSRLCAAANPSDLLVSFNCGDDIDHMMWIAGFAAGFRADEAGRDSGSFETDPIFSDGANEHFASLWNAYYDGWDLRDETVQPPADIFPYSIDGNVSDSLYYRAENEWMQSRIRGIFGREMASPEEHPRYYDGYFYLGHIGDVECRLWGGYDYTIDTVVDLSDGYYKIEGTAIYHLYTTGEPEEWVAYKALVLKDEAADFSYYLIEQMFGDTRSADDGEADEGTY